MPQPIFAQPSSEADYQSVLLAYRRAETGRKKERLQIVLLSLEGKTPPQIAQLVQRHVYTVRYWLHQFNCGGLSALGDKPHPGRSPQLTPSQQRQTIDWVKAQLTTRGRVTCRQIAAWVKQTFNQEIHPESLRRLLHAHRCSWQKAGKRDHRANEAEQRQFIEALHLILGAQSFVLPKSSEKNRATRYPVFFLRRSDFSIKHQYHLHLGGKRATADH